MLVLIDIKCDDERQICANLVQGNCPSEVGDRPWGRAVVLGEAAGLKGGYTCSMLVPIFEAVSIGGLN
jgi:hypothetical protein